jgi:hypothetical protein
MSMGGVRAIKEKPRSNVYHLRPSQGSLWEDVANDVVAPRFDPRRTLVKARVRRDLAELDDGDIPLEEAVQHGLFDADVDRSAFVRAVVDGQPISDREFLRQDTGSDASGHARSQFRAERSRALAAFFNALKRECGYEDAVCKLFSLLSRDTAYMRESPDQWVLQLFVDEKPLLLEAFAGKGREWLYPASPDNEDEEED